MQASYRSRKRLALLILLVGLPLYIVAAWVLLAWIDDRWGRLPMLAEVALFLGLGLVWALPFRAVFRGIGQAEPPAPGPKGEKAGPGDPPSRG